MSARSTVLASLVAAVLLAGCTSSSGPSGSGSTAAGAPSDVTSTSSDGTSPGSGSSSPAAGETPPPAPPDGACYRLTFAQAAEPSDDSSPVPCSGKHDTQTFYVGSFDTVVEGHSVAVDSDHVQQQIESTCREELARFLGGTTEARRLSRLTDVWFAPTLEQGDQGARWFRCDVVALASEGGLASLPPPRRLRGVLDGGGATPYGLCGTAAPGDKGFERVICSKPHRWRAIGTIPLADAAGYPGRSKVSAAGDAPCKELARSRAGDPLTFEYGWEWPTRDQWEAGRRYGYCWAPD
ncbi:septum formation family protein [Nocardioides mesophilus]|uniref:Septum formation family protein n=1 Tax=Nocardioides mesophilus TaxID=433659 RepID=A0A7G9RCL1_9ACTN|nr:septum formation family protein [Nocardioides mesophilus]QNN53336.1 septum formation family protein [Nocardioides mesophilus]